MCTDPTMGKSKNAYEAHHNGSALYVEITDPRMEKMKNKILGRGAKATEVNPQEVR